MATFPSGFGFLRTHPGPYYFDGSAKFYCLMHDADTLAVTSATVPTGTWTNEDTWAITATLGNGACINEGDDLLIVIGRRSGTTTVIEFRIFDTATDAWEASAVQIDSFTDNSNGYTYAHIVRVAADEYIVTCATDSETLHGQNRDRWAIYRTTNGGTSWTRQQVVGTGELFDLSVRDGGPVEDLNGTLHIVASEFDAIANNYSSDSPYTSITDHGDIADGSTLDLDHADLVIHDDGDADGRVWWADLVDSGADHKLDSTDWDGGVPGTRTISAIEAVQTTAKWGKHKLIVDGTDEPYSVYWDEDTASTDNNIRLKQWSGSAWVADEASPIVEGRPDVETTGLFCPRVSQKDGRLPILYGEDGLVASPAVDYVEVNVPAAASLPIPRSYNYLRVFK